MFFISHLCPGAKGVGESLVWKTYMMTPPSHSLGVNFVLEDLKKSLTPCPLQGGHTLSVLQGRWKVGVQVPARREAAEKAVLCGVPSVSLSQLDRKF